MLSETACARIARALGLGLGLLTAAVTGCDEAEDDSGSEAPVGPEGALVGVTLESRVGALLDELPEAERERVAAELLARPVDFWEQRARAQVSLAGYRLVFRNFFYDEAEGKGQLPLPPPELWTFELGAPKRETVAGHDLVVVDYALDATLLAPLDSPAEAEPALAAVGGSWEEPVVFPIDPELLLQRTGYACMDEEEFPPNSVDGENVYTFYDHECEAAIEEDEAENSDCHITEHPDEDCVDALDRAVGSISTSIRFERLAWDAERGDAARVGEVTNPSGADLSVIGSGLENHRLIYRYIDEDSCALAEGCVGGAGWRKLLQFDASVVNVGARELHIGDVDYYVGGEETELGNHNVYVFSECHRHYHFSYYGDFSLELPEAASGSKQAFCLQSTNRYSNNEHSPLTHPYGGCEYQGMQAGWGDDYGAGIECQWLDVTEIAADGEDVDANLRFVANPEGFLCEGEPRLDSEGRLTFEPTEFETESGEPVDRPVCDFATEWESNNDESREVAVFAEGGLITSECERGQLGPLRDCGFGAAAEDSRMFECTPGELLRLSCSVEADGMAQVVRFCDYSQVLGSGVACVYRDALANALVGADGVSLEVPCPDARGPSEPGGRVSVYVGALVPWEVQGDMSCALEG